MRFPLLALLLVFACSKEDPLPAPNSGILPRNPGTTATDSGSTTEAGSSDASIEAEAGDAGDAGDGGLCTPPIQQRGDVIDQKIDRAAAPAATGGQISPGTYVLTSSKDHTSDLPNLPDGAVLATLGAITFEIDAATLRAIHVDEDETSLYGGSYTTDPNANTFTFSPSCRTEGGSGVYLGVRPGTKYSATPTTITLIVTSPIPGHTGVNVYTKK